jgi:uncharacterized RDD family membrane protein YckC
MTPAADPPPPAIATLPTPGLVRRMAAFVYEGVLLFGVVSIAGYLYATLTQQRHALQGQTGLQAFVFVVLGVYFVTFWSRGGQTVAQRAWHIRVVGNDGAPIGQTRALARYLASWVWFLPALASAHFAGLRSGLEIFTLLTVGVVAYALLALVHPQRQFWHDALCGTRLVTWNAKTRRAQSGA